MQWTAIPMYFGNRLFQILPKSPSTASLVKLKILLLKVLCTSNTFLITAIFSKHIWADVFTDRETHCIKYLNFTLFSGWKVFGKAQFMQSFGRFPQNSANLCVSQNFCTRRLGEILVFYSLIIT